MRQSFAAVILISLLLAGCGFQTFRQTEHTPTAATGDQSGQLKEIGTSLPVSFRCLDPEAAVCRIWGTDAGILLLTEEASGALLRLYSAGICTAEAHFPSFPQFQDPSIRLSGNRFCFYDREQSRLCMLDMQLNEVRLQPLPKELQGCPIASPSGEQIYYCMGGSLWAADTITVSPLLLHDGLSENAAVSGLLLNDSVIECRSEEETCYYLSSNGAAVTDPNSIALQSELTVPFCEAVSFGNYSGLVYGNGKGRSTMILPRGFRLVGMLPEVESAIAFSEDDHSLHLFDLSSGMRISCAALPEDALPLECACAAGNEIYLLLQYGVDQVILCQWNTAEDRVQDKTVYSITDASAIALQEECLSEAKRLSQKYGIRILIGEAAAKVPASNYRFVPENLTPILKEELSQLESTLSMFPEGFFDHLKENSGETSICLVRAIEVQDKHNAREAASGLLIWDGTDSFLMLETGRNSQKSFLHALCHRMDTRIFACSDAYDIWNTLNPKDFSYDNDYAANSRRFPENYLEPGMQSFIDIYSMSFPREDRARILEAALEAGNEELFRCAILQNKLQKLCIGIREAFHLTKYPVKLPWEQYVWKSLIEK